MRFEIALNGKVYEVEVQDGRAQLGAVAQSRPTRYRVARAGTAPAGDSPPTVGPSHVATSPVAASPAGVPNPQPQPPAAPQQGAGTVPGAELVSAPMPGQIRDVRVQPGQRVSTGQVLVILEAMKMENEIVSPSDAVVAEILVGAGQTVNAGAPLITLG